MKIYMADAISMRSQIDFASAIILKSWIVHHRYGKFREIPFGTGHVNFEEAIKAAWELGVRKYVTEFWYTGNPNWMNDLVYANQKFSSILQKQM